MQVEGGDIARPSWLGFAVHLFNSAVAWTDILIAHPRSFSRRSERISLGLILFFTLWILLCSYFNGAFPYPFLNALPWPQVSPLRSAAGMAVRQGGTQVGCSHLGRAFRRAFLTCLPLAQVRVHCLQASLDVSGFGQRSSWCQVRAVGLNLQAS